MIFQKICRALALPMAVVMFLHVGPLPVVHAAMVSTEQVIREDAATENRERVMTFLAREDMRREMEALGIDPEEATARTKALSEWPSVKAPWQPLSEPRSLSLSFC